MRISLEDLFCAHGMTTAGEQVLRQLSEHFEEMLDYKNHLTRPWRCPNELLKLADETLTRSPAQWSDVDQTQIAKKLAELTSLQLSSGHRLHSPMSMGHQVSPSVPIAGFFEAVSSTTNGSCGIFEMGPWGSAVERALVHRLGGLLGWVPEKFGGFGTHGGSIANLTAILTARNIKLQGSWESGTGDLKPGILVSEESHYSVARAAGIMGLGARAVIKAKVDHRRCLRIEYLEKALQEAQTQGVTIFCLVATSGTTPTGSFDNLLEVREFCVKHNIWMHVDAAHGGGLMFSKKHRHWLTGLELADSITWDAHKMMSVPSLSTFLLFQRKEDSYCAFRQNAPYLFGSALPETMEFDGALRTLECTKRAIGSSLWALWSIFGTSLLEEIVDRTVSATEIFYQILRKAPDFEPLHEPHANILCFRYLPSKSMTPDELSDHQIRIRTRLLKEGRTYITTTALDGASCLRVVVMNPLTTSEHFDFLLDLIRKASLETTRPN